jgi:hypothetical protein
MFRFQYGVKTNASRQQAWGTFCDWPRWNRFANIYGAIRWSEGEAWEAGSRLEIEVLRPVRMVVNHVITSCKPAHRVGWIDHSLGVVLAQWVTFEELANGGTRVVTWGDIVHSGEKIAGRSVEQLVASFTETWYENFRAKCDLVAEAAEAGNGGAENYWQAPYSLGW